MTPEDQPEGERPSRWTATTIYPDMWVDPDEDPRESLDEGTGEKAVLAAYLDRYRMTFEMKCEGLDSKQLARRSVAPSTMSLLGLLRHLASVEHTWFRRFVEGQQDLPRLYKSPDDSDLDFNGAFPDDAVVADAWETWRCEVAHGREVFAGLDDPGALVGPRGNQAEVRDVVVHRHCCITPLQRDAAGRLAVRRYGGGSSCRFRLSLGL